MVEDGLRMSKDGLKNHPRIFFMNAGLFSSRMVEDGLRMAKDDLKDHPRIFS